MRGGAMSRSDAESLPGTKPRACREPRSSAGPRPTRAGPAEPPGFPSAGVRDKKRERRTIARKKCGGGPLGRVEIELRDFSTPYGGKSRMA